MVFDRNGDVSQSMSDILETTKEYEPVSIMLFL